jgi:saccharopine dehydrogenase-like NADP-dependent oxidoreductase
MNPSSYLIIGCGHFGSEAAEKILRKNPGSKIIVVDRKKEDPPKSLSPPH